MAETVVFSSLATALLGGVLPALVWLWFWHKQDSNCPEPKGLVMISFVAGMAIVYLVLPIEQYIVSSLPSISQFIHILSAQFSFVPPPDETIKVFLWSFTEELAKFITVFFIAIQSKFFDEPTDAIIYLITAALGFAAMENALYILRDLTDGGLAQILLNGNLRFIGATILHTVSSAFIGITIALAFYYPRHAKIFVVTLGILIATLLHTYFNLSIMDAQSVSDMLAVFAQFWLAIFIIIVLVRIIRGIHENNNTCTTTI